MKLVVLAHLTVWGLAATVGFADNEIKVRVWSKSGTFQDSFFDAGDPVAVSVAANTDMVNIWAIDAVSDIGPVTISGTDATDLEVFIGSGAFPFFGEGMTRAGGDLGGLDFTDDSVRNSSRFAGRIRDNLTGLVDVGRMYRFDVDGEIQAQIHAQEEGPGLFDINAGSIATSGRVICHAGNIGDIRIAGDIAGAIISLGGSIGLVETTNGGDLLADVTAAGTSSGTIDEISISGNIGTSLEPVTILAEKDWTPSFGPNVRQVSASAIWADIVASTDPGSVRGDMELLQTTSGDFVGSLSVSAMQGPPLGSPVMDIAGHLDADVHALVVKRPVLVGGTLPVSRLFKIETDLREESPIALAAGGLQGQIIINEAQNNWTWDGDVTIGSITLGPNESQPEQAPHYERSSVDLGGGAIGVVPFNFHPKDSWPEHGSTVVDAVPTQAVVQHYGPVHRTTGLSGAGVVTVERRPIGGGTWTDVSSNFVVDATTAHAGFERQIIIKPTSGNAFENEMEYQIKPVAGKLVCSLVSGCPDVKWDPTYYQFAIDVP